MNRRQIIKTLSLVLGSSLSVPVFGAMAEQVHNHHVKRLKAYKKAYQYNMFNKQQLAVVGSLADTIIPRTNTPGASDVAVPAFIDLMLAEWYDEKDAASYMAGLAEFTINIQNKYGTEFSKLSAEKCYAEVEALDLKVHGKGEDNLFYAMTKELTLIGYYTSEEAMDKELHYQGLIGEFDFGPSGPPGSVTRY